MVNTFFRWIGWSTKENTLLQEAKETNLTFDKAERVGSAMLCPNYAGARMSNELRKTKEPISQQATLDGLELQLGKNVTIIDKQGIYDLYIVNKKIVANRICDCRGNEKSDDINVISIQK